MSLKLWIFGLLALVIFQPLDGIAATNGWTPDNGNGTFTNPLMWGDWPDPDVIRVGDDFYFISTSMHYVPGCPIAKSKDFVNWQMAGYVVPRYDEDSRYAMKGGTLYVNGSWASTIRYHNGLFYVGFCTPYGHGTKKGHFSICTATNVSGPWTRTIFPEYLYDPGLLFDGDGKVYVVHGQGTLYVTEVGFKAAFAYSTNGKDFQPIGNELKMALGLPWTANRFALFNFSTKDSGIGGCADFNWFHYSCNSPTTAP